jgi:iron complex transport system substrate-binding protein
MPCGYDLAGAIEETRRVAHLPVWRELPAFAHGRLYAVDATSYFSRPGPRVVDGVEILAGLLHPDRWPAPTPSQAQAIAHLFAICEP